MILKIIAILFCAGVLFFAGYGIGNSFGYDDGFDNGYKLGFKEGSSESEKGVDDERVD